MFHISKIPKQLTGKVALDVAVSNTSSVCRSVTNLATTQIDIVNEEPFLGTIEIISTHCKDNQWMIELLLNGKPVQFKIDTGADVTAVSEEYSRNWMKSL